MQEQDSPQFHNGGRGWGGESHDRDQFQAGRQRFHSNMSNAGSMSQFGDVPYNRKLSHLTVPKKTDFAAMSRIAEAEADPMGNSAPSQQQQQGEGRTTLM